MVQTVADWLFLVSVTNSISINSTTHESTLAVLKTYLPLNECKIVYVIGYNFTTSITQKKQVLTTRAKQAKNFLSSRPLER